MFHVQQRRRTGLNLRKGIIGIDSKTQGVFIVFDEKTSSVGGAKCFQVTNGVLSLDLNKMTSKYSQSVGLVLTFPILNRITTVKMALCLKQRLEV